MTTPHTVPVWHIHGDTHREIGEADVTLDPKTGETTIASLRWEPDAVSQLAEDGAGAELECFLVLELQGPRSQDGTVPPPLQVLALPIDRYTPVQVNHDPVITVT